MTNWLKMLDQCKSLFMLFQCFKLDKAIICVISNKLAMTRTRLSWKHSVASESDCRITSVHVRVFQISSFLYSWRTSLGIFHAPDRVEHDLNAPGFSECGTWINRAIKQGYLLSYALVENAKRLNLATCQFCWWMHNAWWLGRKSHPGKLPSFLIPTQIAYSYRNKIRKVLQTERNRIKRR